MPGRSTLRTATLAALIGGAVVAAAFLWQGKAGFSLWDEGFLWYGAQRTVAGEVPIRDFMAYDPCRYYLAAAVMALGGDDGVMALRVVLALVQWAGLAVGLATLACAERRARALDWAVAALVLALWMFPRHKMFDVTTCLMLLAVLAHLAAAPRPSRYALAGLAVGLAALIGRNHGLYGLVATLLLVAYLRARGDAGTSLWRCALFFGAGVLAGYLPMLVLLATVPGFAASFAESVRFLFAIEGTNLGLPTPWPWNALAGEGHGVEMLRRFTLGAFFVLLPAWIVAGVAWLVMRSTRAQPTPPLLAACVALAIPYAHYAFSRADVGHLAQGIFPLLVGTLLVLASSRRAMRWTASAALIGASAFVALPNHPGWYCLRAGACVDSDTAGTTLRVDGATASDLALLHRLADDFAPGGRSVLVTPNWPGAYAVLHRRAADWEIYALFPRDEAFQAREIARIDAAAPGFVLIFDLALDGRDALRFPRTHPLIDRYVREHFRRVEGYTSNPAYRIYAGRAATP